MTSPMRTLLLLMIGYLFGAITYYMLVALMVLNLTAHHTDPTLIGVLAACQPLGVLLALLSVAWLVQRYNARMVFLASYGLLLLATLSFALHTALLVWAVASIVSGFATGVSYVLAESWIAVLAPDERRGQVVSLFETSIGAAALVSPGILLLTSTTGTLPFLVAAAGALLALLCLLPMHPPDGLHSPAEPISLPAVWHTLLRLGPVVLMAALLGGLYESGIPTVLPPFSVGAGFSITQATVLVAVIGAGSVAQVPIGYLADRFTLPRLLVASTLLLIAASLFLPLARLLPALLWILGFVWGMFGGGLYTLAIIRMGATLRGIQLIYGTTAIYAAYVIGSVLGPLLGGAALSLSPVYGLSLVFGGLGLVGLVLIGAVRTRRPIQPCIAGE